MLYSYIRGSIEGVDGGDDAEKGDNSRDGFGHGVRIRMWKWPDNFKSGGGDSRGIKGGCVAIWWQQQNYGMEKIL